MELREHPVEWVIAGMLLITLLLGTADFRPAASHSPARFTGTAENM
jgi:hypothetical protein